MSGKEMGLLLQWNCWKGYESIRTPSSMRRFMVMDKIMLPAVILNILNSWGGYMERSWWIMMDSMRGSMVLIQASMVSVFGVDFNNWMNDIRHKVAVTSSMMLKALNSQNHVFYQIWWCFGKKQLTIAVTPPLCKTKNILFWLYWWHQRPQLIWLH